MVPFNQEDVMEKRPVDISNLQDMIFESRQIVALLENQKLWLQIPLVHRFAIVESSEFMILMGKPLLQRHATSWKVRLKQ